MRKRIHIFHLFNDYSGSPLVLKKTIETFKQQGAIITVHTSDSEGFLSSIPKVDYVTNTYNWHPWKLVTLYRFFVMQLRWMIQLLLAIRSTDIVYINTLLPFGPALIGKLFGKEVIYHMHEPQVHPQVLFSFLKKVTENTAQKVVFVSDYLQSCFPTLRKRGQVVHNVLSEKFLTDRKEKMSNQRFTVLMLCSNKAYKGIHEFAELAVKLPTVSFEIVLNASPAAITPYREEYQEVSNLFVYSTQKDVHQFYQRAHLLVNLSQPTQWVESFGMTVLEAMSYQIPCIVPEVGGIAELVNDGENGYTISSVKIEAIASKIKRLSEGGNQYTQMSNAAYQRSLEFLPSLFDKKMGKLLSSNRKSVLSDGTVNTQNQRMESISAN